MQLITMSEAARLLQMSQSTVIRLANANKIVAVRPAGPRGHRRIVASSVERHLQSLLPTVDCLVPESPVVIDDLQSLISRCKRG